jgi:hypothetical protein
MMLFFHFALFVVLFCLCRHVVVSFEFCGTLKVLLLCNILLTTCLGWLQRYYKLSCYNYITLFDKLLITLLLPSACVVGLILHRNHETAFPYPAFPIFRPNCPSSVSIFQCDAPRFRSHQGTFSLFYALFCLHTNTGNEVGLFGPVVIPKSMTQTHAIEYHLWLHYRLLVLRLMWIPSCQIIVARILTIAARNRKWY